MLCTLNIVRLDLMRLIFSRLKELTSNSRTILYIVESFAAAVWTEFCFVGPKGILVAKCLQFYNEERPLSLCPVFWSRLFPLGSGKYKPHETADHGVIADQMYHQMYTSSGKRRFSPGTSKHNSNRNLYAFTFINLSVHS